MTQNDLILIEQAKCLPWDMIDNLIDEAESRECKLKLVAIQKQKYHKEECEAGIL